MQNTLHVGERTDNIHNVGMRFPIVNANIDTKLTCELHLRDEILHLLFLIGIGIMIVKTNLAKTNDLIRLIENHFTNFSKFGIHIIKKTSVGGVNTYGRIHISVFFRLSNDKSAGLRTGTNIDDI